MSQNKIYVGNLSYDTDEAQLEAFFSQYGDIKEAKLIMDRETGRSKGFAFITFGSDQEAQAAISAANQTELQGRTIKVNMAKDDNRRGGGGRGDGGGRRW